MKNQIKPGCRIITLKTGKILKQINYKTMSSGNWKKVHPFEKQGGEKCPSKLEEPCEKREFFSGSMEEFVSVN